MRIDQHREHAPGAIRFDETHTAHVRCQIVDVLRVPSGFQARFAPAQVEPEILGSRQELEPVMPGLHVDGAHPPVAIGDQVGDQVAADEAAGAGDGYECVGTVCH